MRGVGAGAILIALLLACGGAGDGQDLGRADPELQRKVEELVPRLEALSHLEARRTPVARRASNANLEAYLIERLDAEFPGDTLAHLRAVYSAFGLLPDTIDLRRLFVDLMLEQAVGYYDPVRDIFFVRADAPAEMLDAVLVHELVHAIQDQHVDLDSLMHSVDGNDARTAIQAAIEGHATLAMTAFQLAEASGREVPLDALPEMDPGMMDAMVAASGSPELQRAPAIVQRPLLFAYIGGARYVQRLWRAQESGPAPFGEWLPGSTEQLLHTEKILGERDVPVSLRLAGSPPGWRASYSSDLGELETRIYFEEHLGDREAAARAAAGWDGDAYTLLERDGAQALVWYTAWDSSADAEEFAAAYRQAFRARFGGFGEEAVLTAPDRQARIERVSLDGLPVVRVLEGPVGIELPMVEAAIGG